MISVGLLPIIVQLETHPLLLVVYLLNIFNFYLDSRARRVLTYFGSQLKASIEIPLTLACPRPEARQQELALPPPLDRSSDFECAMQWCALESETKLTHHSVHGRSRLNLGPEVGDVLLTILLLEVGSLST